MILDHKARALVEKAGGDGAVPWVLMGAYLYYIHDTTILTDGCYDWLADIVREDYDFIRHPHRDLLASLRGQSTSSLYDLKEGDYPLIARSAACRLAGLPRPW